MMLTPLQATCYATVAICFTLSCGCDRGYQSEDVYTREFWIDQWGREDSTDRFSDRYNDRVKVLLQEFEKQESAIEPFPLDAIVGCNDDTQVCYLSLFYYDETGTFAGFVISEYNSNGELIVEEAYRIYPRGTEGHAYASDAQLSFRPRSPGQRKDEGAWTEYREKGIITREALPTIYVGLPSDDRRVEVALIDLEGNRSAALPLHVYGSPTTSAAAP